MRLPPPPSFYVWTMKGAALESLYGWYTNDVVWWGCLLVWLDVYRRSLKASPSAASNDDASNDDADDDTFLDNDSADTANLWARYEQWVPLDVWVSLFLVLAAISAWWTVYLYQTRPNELAWMKRYLEEGINVVGRLEVASSSPCWDTQGIRGSVMYSSFQLQAGDDRPSSSPSEPYICRSVHGVEQKHATDPPLIQLVNLLVLPDPLLFSAQLRMPLETLYYVELPACEWAVEALQDYVWKCYAVATLAATHGMIVQLQLSQENEVYHVYMFATTLVLTPIMTIGTHLLLFQWRIHWMMFGDGHLASNIDDARMPQFHLGEPAAILPLGENVDGSSLSQRWFATPGYHHLDLDQPSQSYQPPPFSVGIGQSTTSSLSRLIATPALGWLSPKHWCAGEDTVFAVCGGGGTIVTMEDEQEEEPTFLGKNHSNQTPSVQDHIPPKTTMEPVASFMQKTGLPVEMITVAEPFSQDQTMLAAEELTQASGLE